MPQRDQQFNFRFRKEYCHAPKYRMLVIGLVLLILYKLRLSGMGSDVGQIFPTGSYNKGLTRYCMHWYVRKNDLTWVKQQKS